MTFLDENYANDRFKKNANTSKTTKLTKVHKELRSILTPYDDFTTLCAENMM